MFINDVEFHMSDSEDIIIDSVTSKTSFKCINLLVSAFRDYIRGVESVCRDI